MALCDIDDINAHLPDNVVEANEVNTKYIQVSAERVIRSSLAGVVTTMDGWTSPDTTPDIIREITSRMVACKLYFQATSATALDIDERNFGQLLCDSAQDMLTGILNGTLTIIDDGTVIVTMSGLVFWPDDTAPRYFTSDMEFA